MPNWGGGLKGAGGGAMAGASVAGPYGALVGGAIGGLAGLFGGGPSAADQAYQQKLQDFYSQIGGGREAPQAGAAAQGAYSGFRSNQSNLITRLEALSSGQGPSLASQQFKEATDRNQASQVSMASSGRGGNMAAFQAANNSALLGSQAAQGSASARIAEQQMALQQLGGAINQGRNSDESMNQFNAGQTNQTSLANLDARLRQMGLDDQTRLHLLEQMGGNNNSMAGRTQLGDQILAGGAGMYGQYVANKGQNPQPGSANAKQAQSPGVGAFQGYGQTGAGIGQSFGQQFGNNPSQGTPYSGPQYTPPGQQYA